MRRYAASLVTPLLILFTACFSDPGFTQQASGTADPFTPTDGTWNVTGAITASGVVTGDDVTATDDVTAGDRLTGVDLLTTGAGSADNPSVTVGDPNSGLYRTGGATNISDDGTRAIDID